MRRLRPTLAPPATVNCLAVDSRCARVVQPAAHSSRRPVGEPAPYALSPCAFMDRTSPPWLASAVAHSALFRGLSGMFWRHCASAVIPARLMDSVSAFPAATLPHLGSQQGCHSAPVPSPSGAPALPREQIPGCAKNLKFAKQASLLRKNARFHGGAQNGCQPCDYLVITARRLPACPTAWGDSCGCPFFQGRACLCLLPAPSLLVRLTRCGALARSFFCPRPLLPAGWRWGFPPVGNFFLAKVKN